MRLMLGSMIGRDRVCLTCKLSKGVLIYNQPLFRGGLFLKYRSLIANVVHSWAKSTMQQVHKDINKTKLYAVA